ncbi:DUF4864 domain-containing protein [Botryobacter ruber]|uniref:DUF4864 domain-containing protein n=1 Tax=Botryobacter ruber TaxID=2171629 RepID=UPI000E0A411E|nr:DUF4864 domain-containing protein [Botryobacter ruber]
MRKHGYILDKLLLGVGIILLVLLWIQFPAQPIREMQVYPAYTIPSSDEEEQDLDNGDITHPSKALSPRQVIQIQLVALQKNDRNDSGIITVFNFSSPANRMLLGPLNHFRIMVRNPAYKPMLNFVSYKAGQLVVTDDTAHQLVVVKGRDGAETAYMFTLTKQKRGPYRGCWLTANVSIMEPESPVYFT